MKAVKYVIGALGVVFALLHLVQGGQKLLGGTTAGEFTVTVYGAHISGVCIGTIVAILCFRPSTKKG